MTLHPNETIISRNVEDEMKESYLRYSMSVIISRALPDARDGLKPSQRRILYAMRQLNLAPAGKHRKCAKISGDTSGDYHPHGEAVIYPTLVRMAQDWVMRYPLVNGQGNFGSIDGDPPAAMRYTEARLTSASVQLMEDLDKDTVDMIPNYDETKKEPTVFPSKFPNLLSNGSSGIAVGMATNIPPHNLFELISATLILLDHPEASIDELMKVLPGPDFPTGGIICGYRGIKEAYHTGRGKLILRGLIHIEDVPDHSDRQRIIIDEIPYNINKSRLIEQIANQINNKVITGVSDLRDESDKDGMRISLDLKRGEIPDVIINQLYKFTDMQITFGCIMLALDKGLPRVMNIKQMIGVWIEHRIEVIRRRTKFELNKAEARAHILEGYLKALDHLDQIVKLIRASNNRDEAKIQLVSTFGFSDKQANAVLDLRLYQLTGLERDKITNEYEELLKKIEYYRAVLANEKMVREIIKEELIDIRKNHKQERKTKIIGAETEMQMEDLIANEQTMITISNDNYIKRMPIGTFREQRRGGAGISGTQLRKEEDAIKGFYVASTHDYLLIFTNFGRCYWLKVWQIPESGRKSKGKPLINLLEDLRPDEKIATTLRVSSFEEQADIFMATQKGTVKKSSLSDFSNPRKKGIWAISLDENDQLIAAHLVRNGQQIMLFTSQGMAVRFDATNVREMGRVARGVRGVKLKDESDKVIGCEVVNGEETILIVCEKGYGKRSFVNEFRHTNRGGVGVKAIIANERNGKVAAALKVVDNQSVIMMSSLGQTIRISMENVRVMGRNTQGVKLFNLPEEGDAIVAVQKLEVEGGEITETLPATKNLQEEVEVFEQDNEDIEEEEMTGEEPIEDEEMTDEEPNDTEE